MEIYRCQEPNPIPEPKIWCDAQLCHDLHNDLPKNQRLLPDQHYFAPLEGIMAVGDIYDVVRESVDERFKADEECAMTHAAIELLRITDR